MPTLRRRTLALTAAPVVAVAAVAAVHLSSAAATTVPTRAASGPSAPQTAGTTLPARDAGRPAAPVHPDPGPPTPGPRTTSTPTSTARPALPSPTASRAAGPSTSVAGPAAPLTVTQLPDPTASWKPLGAPASRATGHRIGLDECTGVTGATAWLQQGWVSAANTPAVQDTFTFATPADAAGALAQAETDLQACQAPLRALQAQHGLQPDAAVTRTAVGTDATAWQYRWDAVPGMSAPGPQLHHVYLARYGDELTVLQYTDLAAGGQTASSTAAGDQDELATLSAALRTNQ